jgi:uncharacterized membrane protein
MGTDEKVQVWRNRIKTLVGFIFLILGLFLMAVQSHASTAMPTNLTELVGIAVVTLSTGERIVVFTKPDGEMEKVMFRAGAEMLARKATGFYLNYRLQGKSIMGEFQLDGSAIATYCIASNHYDTQRFSGATLAEAVEEASKMTVRWEQDGAQIVSLDCQGEGAIVRVSRHNDPVFTKIIKGGK